MIGERIKEYRLKNKMTQQDLADTLSVAKSTIGMWENGNREPDLETIKRIAKFFGVSTDSLISFEDEWDKTVEELNKEFADRDALLTAYLERVFDTESERELAHALILQLPRVNKKCLEALNCIVYELAGKEENMSAFEKEVQNELNYKL